MAGFTSFPCTAPWILLLATWSFAQQQASPPRIDPAVLVRRTVDNEIKKNTSDLHYMFRGTKTTPKGSVTKVYVETREGTAGMAIAYDGKPLTPAQRRAEEGRVRRFVNNPDELRKKRKQEQEDADRTMRIVRALPDAFLYQVAGEEQGSPGIGRPGDPLVKLKFRPNPQYVPPSRVEQVLTGMQGMLLIDAARDRIAAIDGTLFKDVGFGWGFLGHLDRGSHFLVHQQQIGDDRWEVSRMTLEFTGKILLIKKLSLNSTEVYSDYKQVPSDLTFAQALELLEKEGATFAENATTSRLALK